MVMAMASSSPAVVSMKNDAIHTSISSVNIFNDEFLSSRNHNEIAGVLKLNGVRKCMYIACSKSNIHVLIFTVSTVCTAQLV